MKTVYVSDKHRLNEIMLEHKLCLVPNDLQADLAIAWNREPGAMRRHHVILCQTEPPVSRGMIENYQRFDEYHTVITFDPDRSAANQFPFSLTCPHLCPYNPSMQYWRITQEAWRGGKGIYFAGKRSSLPDRETVPGAQRIYQLRAHIAETLLGVFGGECVGEGWRRSTKKAACGWGAQKQVDIERINPAFVLAIENCRMRGYVSEKLFDALVSDRVACYLGPPDIEDYVPANCFVNLGRFVDGDQFDAGACIEYLSTLDRGAVIEAARAYLSTIYEQPYEARRQLTDFVIRRAGMDLNRMVRQ